MRNKEDILILAKYMTDIITLVAKGYKGKKLVEKLEKLKTKNLKKIKSEKIRADLEKAHEKCIKKYIHDYGYDDLELI